MAGLVVASCRAKVANLGLQTALLITHQLTFADHVRRAAAKLLRSYLNRTKLEHIKDDGEPGRASQLCRAETDRQAAKVLVNRSRE